MTDSRTVGPYCKYAHRWSTRDSSQWIVLRNLDLSVSNTILLSLLGSWTSIMVIIGIIKLVSIGVRVLITNPPTPGRWRLSSLFSTSDWEVMNALMNLPLLIVVPLCLLWWATFPSEMFSSWLITSNSDYLFVFFSRRIIFSMPFAGIVTDEVNESLSHSMKLMIAIFMGNVIWLGCCFVALFIITGLFHMAWRLLGLQAVRPAGRPNL